MEDECEEIRQEIRLRNRARKRREKIWQEAGEKEDGG